MPSRALLFEGQQISRPLKEEEVGKLGPLGDSQLLWVDLSEGASPPECVLSLGLDPKKLEEKCGGELGMAVLGDWKYLYVRALNWQEEGEARAEPMVVAIGPNIVLTSHLKDIGFLRGVWDNETDYLRIGHMQALSFACGLLDRMLTDYLDARDAFETKLDKVEMQILKKPRAQHLRDLQSLRRLASRLREYLACQRDLFAALGRPDFGHDKPKEVGEHLQSVSARYGQVMDSIEEARELVNGSFDLYTSRTAESTNQAMHTLTVITVVMGLAATISGVLGMNFDSPLFESGPQGFLVAASVIGSLVVGAIGWAIWRNFSARSAESQMGADPRSR